MVSGGLKQYHTQNTLYKMKSFIEGEENLKHKTLNNNSKLVNTVKPNQHDCAVNFLLNPFIY